MNRFWCNFKNPQDFKQKPLWRHGGRSLAHRPIRGPASQPPPTYPRWPERSLRPRGHTGCPRPSASAHCWPRRTWRVTHLHAPAGSGAPWVQVPDSGRGALCTPSLGVGLGADVTGPVSSTEARSHVRWAGRWAVVDRSGWEALQRDSGRVPRGGEHLVSLGSRGPVCLE